MLSGARRLGIDGAHVLKESAMTTGMRTTRGKMSAAKFGKFYTIEQIADRMEVSTRSVRRWIKGGLLVAHRFNGVVRISEADFKSFLAAHRDH